MDTPHGYEISQPGKDSTEALREQTVADSRPLFDGSYQLPGRGNFDPVPLSTAQNRPGNRIQLRSLALLHIFLHGAAHVRRHSSNSGKHLVWIDSRALGHGHRAGFANTSLALGTPLWIGKNLSNGFVRRGCGQSKRCQKNQLTPHQSRLVVDEAAFEANFLKLLDRASQPIPPRQQHIQPRKRRTMNNVSRTQTLGFHRNGRGNNAIRAILRAQRGNMIDAVEQRNNRSDGIWVLDRGQRGIKLRSLHRNPQYISLRRLGSNCNVNSKVAKRTFEMKLFRVAIESLSSHNQSDRIPSMRQTSTNQSADAASP